MRALSKLALLTALFGGPFTASALAEGPVIPSPAANYVAVVVGLSSYANLPDPIELNFARSDAAIVAKALKDDAHFTHTFLLADGEATREGLRELLRTQVAQLVGPNDIFVLYFVGHGLGGDLELPILLTHDSTVEKADQDGLELQSFAADLRTWTPAGTALIVTDAIHRNQLDGVYFFGPAANQWPAMAQGTMIISSSQPESPATDGAFGTVFGDAMGGAADANNDTYVTSAELLVYLEKRMAGVGQIPVAAGTYSPDMVLSAGVKKRASTAPGATDAPIPEEVPKYPDTEIFSAKFLFKEGASQSVQCRDEERISCAPSCYVRTFKTGPCELSALIDGVEMKGKVIVMWPGKYECGRKGGDLSCKPPMDVQLPSK